MKNTEPDRRGETGADGRGYVHLVPRVLLRHLEEPSVYLPAADELFALDEEAFGLLRRCAETGGIPDAEIRDRQFLDTCIREGILKRSPTPAPPLHPALRQGPLPSLRYLEVQITRRCNLACRHCFLGNARPVDLEPERFRNLLRDFEEIQGLRVLVSGGEPLCHPRFREINAALGDTPLRTVLLSNGVGLAGIDCARLRVDEVQVSLDGMQQGHEALRGPGTFDQAVAGIRALGECGLAVSVATMAHRGNIEELPAMAEFLAGLGVLEWSVDVPCPTGRWERGDLTPDEMRRALGFGFGGSLHGGGTGDTCGAHLMAVTPEGLGAKCGFYADRPLGPIEEGLRTLWDRIPRLRPEDLACTGCKHLETCRGGCRWRAETAGDHLGPDPVKCAAYGVLTAEEPGVQGE